MIKGVKITGKPFYSSIKFDKIGLMLLKHRPTFKKYTLKY